MAIIPQFDTDPILIDIRDRHHAWHQSGAHDVPTRKIPVGRLGSGREFLQFHRDIMTEFFAWNSAHPVNPPLDLAAWRGIPVGLKVGETGWPKPGGRFGNLDLGASESRIWNTAAFANDDELGIFIETTVHNWIHGAVAGAPGFVLPATPLTDLPKVEQDKIVEEQEIIAGFHSVQSTWFYKIHGLVDYWWNRFLHPKNVNKDVIDIGPQTKNVNKEVIDTAQKNVIKDVADTDLHKRFEDVPDPFRLTQNPNLMEELLQRITQLEARVKVKKSPFIQPFMRPDVGHSVTNPEQEKKRE
jgi:hypothetical protein